ncbi:probable G-protein coupled receptor No18 [Branchiostoma floridae]|uniref:Probable G-protein coupled receptor No18 n=1 Tax=Branchiostoma floridae TaxID=7739 RepID=A0A9J7HEG4_BRAFL|nr:probable G-protein coupled receptor No18 [Branchiostoma floridae]
MMLILQVCIAVATERKLRHPQNWLLVSLAASDLLVGSLIMPLSLAHELMGYWAFGPVWCEIWLAMDVFACTASIFNLCLIALERYRCVVNPTAYRRYMQPDDRELSLQYTSYIPILLLSCSPTINRRQGILIAGAYIIAAAISLPPLFGWAEPRAQDGALPMCPLHRSIGYVAFSATASFYIPLIVMVTAYICLIVATRAHLRKKISKRPSGEPLPQPKPAAVSEMKKVDDGYIHLRVMRSTATITGSRRMSVVGSTPTSPGRNQATPPKKPRNPRDKNQGKKIITVLTATASTDRKHGEKSGRSGQGGADISKESSDGKQPKGSFPIRFEEAKSEVVTEALQRIGTKMELQFDRNRKGAPGLSPRQERLKILQSRERRFTLIIGLVMGAFIVCWYPFFQLYPIVVACESCNVPELVFKFFFWIGYCNSAVNPIIYTIFNKDFRGAFLRIITYGFRKRRAHGV